MTAEIDAHNITVHYYNTDDGIWLLCSCGWEVHAKPYFPTIETLTDLASEHRRVTSPEGDGIPDHLWSAHCDEGCCL